MKRITSFFTILLCLLPIGSAVGGIYCVRHCLANCRRNRTSNCLRVNAKSLSNSQSRKEKPNQIEQGMSSGQAPLGKDLKALNIEDNNSRLRRIEEGMRIDEIELKNRFPESYLRNPDYIGTGSGSLNSDTTKQEFLEQLKEERTK
jgi:hypothetical protein